MAPLTWVSRPNYWNAHTPKPRSLWISLLMKAEKSSEAALKDNKGPPSCRLIRVETYLRERWLKCLIIINKGRCFPIGALEIHKERLVQRWCSCFNPGWSLVLQVLIDTVRGAGPEGAGGGEKKTLLRFAVSVGAGGGAEGDSGPHHIFVHLGAREGGLIRRKRRTWHVLGGRREEGRGRRPLRESVCALRARTQ